MTKQERIQEANEIMATTPNTKRLLKTKAVFDKYPKPAYLRALRQSATDANNMRDLMESHHDDCHSVDAPHWACRKCKAQGWT